MDDDPVVLALRVAAAKSDSVELRSALGERLMTLGRAADALAEFEAGLALSPGNGTALAGAARAAEAVGDSARASAYRLAEASVAKTSENTPAVQRADEGNDEADEGEDDEDDLDSEPTDGTEPGVAMGMHSKLRLVASDGNEVDVEDGPSTVTFGDVGGMESVKQRLTRSFIAPLRNPELYKKFGKTIGGGLVLYGPPGCGKTFLARALAGEIGARFMNVSLSDVLDMWFGESERKLHELFENARRRQPCLVFFDEVDALGQRRTALRGSAGRTLVNQLLTELDGYAGRNQGVFFLAATNHPWDLDPALRRPGRFDRLVFVPPPDLEGRRCILELKLRDRPLADGLDLRRIAKRTEGFSGADLEALVNLAAELAVEATLSKGRDVPIDERLLEKALGDVKPSPRPWLEVARNHAVYANEGGAYDDLLEYLRAAGLA